MKKTTCINLESATTVETPMKKTLLILTTLLTTFSISIASACQYVDLDPYNVSAGPDKFIDYAEEALDRGDLKTAREWTEIALDRFHLGQKPRLAIWKANKNTFTEVK